MPGSRPPGSSGTTGSCCSPYFWPQWTWGAIFCVGRRSHKHRARPVAHSARRPPGSAEKVHPAAAQVIQSAGDLDTAAAFEPREHLAATADRLDGQLHVGLGDRIDELRILAGALAWV